MNDNKRTQEPLSNLAYDWVTIIQHKSEALRAYQQYIQDAQQANSPECVELMRKIHEQDSEHVREATRHLVEVLGGRMGQEQGQGETSRGESGRMGQGSRAGTSQGETGQAGTSRAASQGGMGGMGQGEGNQNRMGQASSQSGMGSGMSQGENRQGGSMQGETGERRGQNRQR
ncbi:hypothetical protein [Nannocystis punicea]|uniref:Rubrerythrin n=1 Tax=Nannocystis punicea TaxID=2995304 RepID=A0ABY7GS81_9BACT|nr:hypothetical protein [Nannocystis poenicansa]WAS89792.1 hypothetical protein O0S08_26675 [Nannocystis poenicansa]